MTPLLTNRQVVRQFRESDLADFLEYQSHPAIRKYMPGEAMDEVQAEAFIKKQATLSDGDRDVYHAFAVCLIDDDRLIGDIGMYLPSGPDRVGDLGFQFHPDFHGQGYASEAAKALVRHAFIIWNLDRITSHCDAQNASSYRLMERIGMLPTESDEKTSLAYELTLGTWLAGQLHR